MLSSRIIASLNELVNMKYIVSKEQTLLEALAEHYPDSSKTTLREWVKQERVAVDGEVVKRGDVLLTAGASISLMGKKQWAKGGIEIIYEDRYLVVIEKPAGVLTVATAFEKKQTAYVFLKEHYRPGTIYVVHRLDQETSGVMLFARTEKVKEKLKEMFEAHHLERGYTAVVEGEVKEASGVWSCYLYEDSNYVVHPTKDPSKGRLAVTHFEVKGRSKEYTLLELKLETGRKNQIRVHCRLAGHPVVGDEKYGSVRNPLNRLGLHAKLLTFKHPATGQQMRFESPLPEEFEKIRRRLKHA